MDYFAAGIAWYVIFLVSLTFHEAAHGYAALKLGDTTASSLGLATLDPLPHIRREPSGTIFIPLLSFIFFGWMIGWASTPYNPYWAKSNRKKSALMALAGPGANLLLFLLAVIIIRTGLKFGFFQLPEQITFTQITTASSAGLANSLAVLVSILFSLNLILFVFNLIPLPPFDGSGVLFFFLGQGRAEKYERLIQQPHYRIIGLIIAWNLLGIILGPARRLAINLIYAGISL